MRPLARLFAPLCALPLLLAGAPALAEAPVPAAQVAPESRPALWKVSDADTTIWLFGTIHVLPHGGAPWLTGPVAQALRSSDSLVTEILPGDPASAGKAAAAHGFLPEGEHLFALLGPERTSRLQARLAQAGIPTANVDRMKPWFAALVLSLAPLTKLGYSASDGAERTLAAAHPAGQDALETAEFQLALMDSLPRDAQIAWLDATIAQFDTAPAQIDAMIAAWRKGDAQGLARMMTADMSDDPRLLETLLMRRNANWAQWIEKRLKQPGTVFIAVGAGHLAGKGSVQERLTRDGLTVTRVQ